MSPAQARRLLYHESGLKGLSGISGDVRADLAGRRPGERAGRFHRRGGDDRRGDRQLVERKSKEQRR